MFKIKYTLRSDSTGEILPNRSVFLQREGATDKVFLQEIGDSGVYLGEATTQSVYDVYVDGVFFNEKILVGTSGSSTIDSYFTYESPTDLHKDGVISSSLPIKTTLNSLLLGATKYISDSGSNVNVTDIFSKKDYYPASGALPNPILASSTDIQIPTHKRGYEEIRESSGNAGGFSLIEEVDANFQVRSDINNAICAFKFIPAENLDGDYTIRVYHGFDDAGIFFFDSKRKFRAIPSVDGEELIHPADVIYEWKAESHLDIDRDLEFYFELLKDNLDGTFSPVKVRPQQSNTSNMWRSILYRQYYDMSLLSAPVYPTYDRKIYDGMLLLVDSSVNNNFQVSEAVYSFVVFDVARTFVENNCVISDNNSNTYTLRREGYYLFYRQNLSDTFDYHFLLTQETPIIQHFSVLPPSTERPSGSIKSDLPIESDISSFHLGNVISLSSGGSFVIQDELRGTDNAPVLSSLPTPRVDPDLPHTPPTAHHYGPYTRSSSADTPPTSNVVKASITTTVSEDIAFYSFGVNLAEDLHDVDVEVMVIDNLTDKLIYKALERFRSTPDYGVGEVDNKDSGENHYFHSSVPLYLTQNQQITETITRLDNNELIDVHEGSVSGEPWVPVYFREILNRNITTTWHKSTDVVHGAKILGENGITYLANESCTEWEIYNGDGISNSFDSLNLGVGHHILTYSGTEWLQTTISSGGVVTETRWLQEDYNSDLVMTLQVKNDLWRILNLNTDPLKVALSTTNSTKTKAQAWANPTDLTFEVL